MKILITGGNGYIARSLAKGLENKHTITSIARKDFDLIDSRATNSWFDEHSYDVVIHTAISGGSRLANDGVDALDNNLRMHYNFVQNKDKFKRLISFGSGAEIFKTDTLYGLSKKIIAQSIQNIKEWYNLRIYSVFDENELNTRFIKSNIIRYMKKEPMIVHADKMMDFMYMEDLVQMVNCYIESDDLPKQVDCSYEKTSSLFEIASFINELGTHRVPILVQGSTDERYCRDEYKGLPMKHTVGLHEGIRKVYRILNERV